MFKRLLSATPQELLSYNKEELLKSIKLSEGRTIISEVIGEESLLRDISNAEVASAFGADILLLNLFDLNDAQFKNINGNEAKKIVSEIKRLTGCPLGLNLEPVVNKNEEFKELSKGRRADVENMAKAVAVNFDILTFTGNPSVGVSNQEILNAVKIAAENFGDDVIITAGKMHMAGINEEYLDKEYIDSLIKAGADIILLPAPATIPGVDIESLQEIIKLIHRKNKLALTAIGTSQESSDQEVIREIALKSKMAGADIQHIGDAAYGGMALPENITVLSKTIRGKRHTYRKMSQSILR